MISRFLEWCSKSRTVYTNNINYWFVTIASWYMFVDLIVLVWF